MYSFNHIHTLYNELDWLKTIIDQVIRSYLLQEGHENDWQQIEPPVLEEDDSYYAQLVQKWKLNTYDRIAIALTLAPYLRPEILDIFFAKNQLYDRGFTEFGGVVDGQHSGFIPTGQTFCWILTAVYPELRVDVEEILGRNSLLIKEQFLVLGDTPTHIPQLNGTLSLGSNWLHYLYSGEKLPVEQSISFPAKRIETYMNWEDVVLSNPVLDQLEEIATWINHSNEIMDRMELKKLLKPGYRSLFYGPPGTGKTLTATLIGKTTQREVYKVDLSMIVSKYIGETEKNLARVFDIAQHKDWILFFDEADALFGKRTVTESSNDRHANQQTAYLLQRIEDFPGVVILASNLKANMDDAFTRRFQSMIHFPMPSAEERYTLLKNAFSLGCKLDENIDLYSIAEKHELSGGSIANVLRYCAVKTMQKQNTLVDRNTLLAGIKQELHKENKTMQLN